MKKQTAPSYYEVTPIENLREMLTMAATENGEHTAFIFRTDGLTESVSYGQFFDSVKALSTALNELAPGENHIAMLGENRYDWILTYLAVLCSDSVFMPVDRELPPENMFNVLREGDASLLVCTSKYEELIAANRDKFPNVKTVIAVDRDEDGDGFISFNRLIGHGRELVEGGDTFFTDREVDTSKLKMLVFTSGTTGIAKGVMLSEHNLVSSVYYGLQVSTVYERCLSVLPYNHTYEAVSGILVSLHKRATICINETLKTVMKNLAAYKPDYIYLVPAFAEEFYRRIWANARSTGKDKALKKLIKFSNAMLKTGVDLRAKLFVTIRDAFGGNLRKIVCGGAPIRPELGDFFESIGIPLINGYGITECSPLVSANQDAFNFPETVGAILPCLDVKIDRSVMSDGDETEMGEICVRGDVVMMGYYKRPDLTAKVMDDDGYFHTGDIGQFNKDHLLMITGRIKNLIVLQNGKNVYPEEIEELIQSIPYVAEVIISAKRDAAGAETSLYAEVYPREDAVKELGIEDVKAKLTADVAAACSELPTYKRPREVIVRDEPFEKTTSNKIKRKYS